LTTVVVLTIGNHIGGGNRQTLLGVHVIVEVGVALHTNAGLGEDVAIGLGCQGTGAATEEITVGDIT
jgi:hypothetical protein